MDDEYRSKLTITADTVEGFVRFETKHDAPWKKDSCINLEPNGARRLAEDIRLLPEADDDPRTAEQISQKLESAAQDVEDALDGDVVTA